MAQLNFNFMFFMMECEREDYFYVAYLVVLITAFILVGALTIWSFSLVLKGRGYIEQNAYFESEMGYEK